MLKQKIFTFMTLISILITSNLYAEDKIKILYHERPPYVVTDSNGVVSGITANVVNKAFQNAKIAHFWQKIPSKRQIMILKKNKGKNCLVGWFKNSNREKFAKFTKSIHQDESIVGLSLFSNTKINSGQTIEKVFQNKDLTLLIKSGYSYGLFIDNLIKKYNPNHDEVTVENINMLRMINLARVDYFFTTKEEMKSLIKSAGYSLHDYKFIEFSNMPLGNKRYILCNLKVEDETMDKLNAWIP